MKRRLFLDMDGTLTEWRSSASMEDLHKRGYFLSLRPQTRLVRGIRRLLLSGTHRALHVEVYILTSYLPDSPYAKAEKLDWVKRQLPELSGQVIFVPYGRPKSEYVGPLSRHDFLLDDYKVNLEQWGGTAVKYLNGINSPWEGPSVRHDGFSPVLELLKIMMAPSGAR